MSEVDDTEELIFDLQVTREEPFKVKNKDGTITKYVVRELDGGGGETFQNAQLNCVKGIDKGGSFKSVSGLGSLEPLLVSLSTYVVETNKLVPIDIVKTWPKKMVTRLYDIAQELSELNTKDDKKTDKENEDDEKN